MLPNWLLKDDFLWQELFKLFLSSIGSLFLAWLIQIVITRRDQKNQETERKRQQINELRNDLVEVFNEYYKVRKRYTTVRDTFTGKRTRNPYIQEKGVRTNEIFDNLLVDCIALEAKYSTLIDKLKTTFPDFWESNLDLFMGNAAASKSGAQPFPHAIRYKIGRSQSPDDSSLESSFHVIRHQIEHEQDIDRSIKENLTVAFQEVLIQFEAYEKHITLKKQAVEIPRTASISAYNRKTSAKSKL